jgi:hypothetical protein
MINALFWWSSWRPSQREQHPGEASAIAAGFHLHRVGGLPIFGFASLNLGSWIIAQVFCFENNQR